MRLAARALVLVLTLIAPAAAFAPVDAKQAVRPAAVVIAVVEEGGMNVLHRDYRARGPVVLPAGMPATRRVHLPATGDFETAVAEAEAGPLGATEPGVLYSVAGTRIIGIYTSKSSRPMNLLTDRFHATGTTSSAVGLEHGTAPEALLVFVPDGSPAAWKWVAEQQWIDVVSTSYHGYSSRVGPCGIRPHVREILRSGRLVVSAAGNAESIGPMFEPAGIPESYQVGGVDDQGRPFLPTADSPGFSSRPYETGDRFAFAAASADAVRGSMSFGGTSGAAPSTAGRAARLIGYARELLRSSARDRGRTLARADDAGAPQRGPLSDGDLTVSELTELLHRLAVPALPASPIRYLAEGYGALSDSAISRGRDVLAGRVELPARPEDDAMHARIEELRETAWSQQC